MPFDSAVLEAADMVFSKAPKPASSTQQLVIDPLVDGLTGTESRATQSIEGRIVDLVEREYPQFEVMPFTAGYLANSPQVLIGTFTGVNKSGKPVGERKAFKFYLTLLDLKSGKVVSKAWMMVKPQGVDITPTPFFRDSPTWMKDPAIQAYIKSCHGTKVGDPINPLYLERIKAAALVSEAIDAYDKGDFKKAQGLYRQAAQTRGGDQLRVFNGLYLTSTKLGQRRQAAESFEGLVSFGLDRDRLAVKFLFRPGSTAFVPQQAVSGDYPMWLENIAKGVSRRQGCLEVQGHSSRTGPEPVNERLSLGRAEQIKGRLEQHASDLAPRTIAVGKGSRETLVGSGTDDVRDALDRRVEFDVIACNPSGANGATDGGGGVDRGSVATESRKEDLLDDGDSW